MTDLKQISHRPQRAGPAAKKKLRQKATKTTIAQDLAGQHGPLMDHYCPKLRPQTIKTIAPKRNH
jgi:hypothetical protein